MILVIFQVKILKWNSKIFSQKIQFLDFFLSVDFDPSFFMSSNPSWVVEQKSSLKIITSAAVHSRSLLLGQLWHGG